MEESEFTKEYPQLSKELPPPVLEVLISPETPAKISAICQKNGIGEEEKISGVAYQIGKTLLGDLPLNEFQKILSKEVKLAPQIAEKIAQEINRLIFSPVKDELDKLYPSTIPEKSVEEPKKPLKKDTYRETVE